MREGSHVLMLFAALALAAQSAPAAKQAPVSGVYRANGKDAKLAYAIAVKHDAFMGKDAITVILTEKDPKGEEKPEITATFGKLGSALLVSFTKDGSIFGCEVAHAALKHMGASSIGTLKLEGLEWKGGQVKGRLTTKGPAKLFDETWDADLTFEAKTP